MSLVNNRNVKLNELQIYNMKKSIIFRKNIDTVECLHKYK
ncbi:hypothetical protein CTK_C06340 [Clostridium tyrobutyricum]|nr:hypothetical protein CTK_C06340 [Clostridium tyrobutyricum]